MLKRMIFAILAVFVTWQILDWLIHGVLLGQTYADTAHLWRPEEEMKMGSMALVSLTAATLFVAIYAYLIRPKALISGLLYGLLFGLSAGVSMGFGTYCVMPIPQKLAMVWFLGSVFQSTIGGLLAGGIIRETTSA